MKAINLKTDYLINPIGIDIKNPRLMWNCDGGKKQTAYRILAICGGQTVWDSGKVNPRPCAPNIPTACLPAVAWNGRCSFGMKTIMPETGRKRLFLRRGFCLRETGRQGGSRAITASIKGNAIPWIVSKKVLRQTASGRRGCTLPPAGCTRRE